MISRVLSKYLFYFTALFAIPLAVAIYYQLFGDNSSHPQPHSVGAFFLSFLISLAAAVGFRFLGRNATGQLYRRESLIAAVLIWLATSLIAALPFYFSGTLTNPIDACFEAMSGLTTTGSSLIAPKAYDPTTGEEKEIYITHTHIPHRTYSYYGTVAPIRDPVSQLVTHSGIEAVSKAVLLWRSLLQWIGGMGIVLIFLSVLPAIGVGGKFLYQAEATGPIKEGITPRVQQTASLLWKLYLFLTLLEISLLIWTNGAMPIFDAICIALSNISTGGFSVRNDSIASYQNSTTEWIVLLFMIAGSINFSLYFHCFRGTSLRSHLPDLFLFLSIALIGSLLVSFFLIGSPQTSLEGAQQEFYSFGTALRQGFFQAISAQSSTGFITADYNQWPFPSQMFLLLLMFIGGMAGSTAGGIKTSRFYILYKIILHRLELLYRPDSIRKLTIGSAEVDDKNALTVLSFFCIAVFFSILGTVIFILDGIDPETALGLMAGLVNNTGLGFRAAGPTDSLVFLSPLSKLLSIFWMLLGRLEFFAILLLFLPSFWKNK